MKMTTQCRLEVFEFTDERGDLTDNFISFHSTNKSRISQSQVDCIRSNKNIPVQDHVEQQKIHETIPKIILKRIPGTSDHYFIKNSTENRKRRKRKKNKSKRSKRKSKHRKVESFSVKNNEVVISISNDEVDNNNNVPLPRLKVKSDDEINDAEEGSPTDISEHLPFVNETLNFRDIFSVGEVNKQDIGYLADILFIVMMAKKRCKFRIEQSQMITSYELTVKEKTLAIEELEGILHKHGPRFTASFANLETKCLFINENPVVVYFYMLYIIHSHLIKVEPDLLINISDMKRLILCLLKENAHTSKIYDVFREDDEHFEDYYSSFVACLEQSSSPSPEQNIYTCSFLASPAFGNMYDKFPFSLPTFECFRAYAVPGMRPFAAPRILRPWLDESFVSTNAESFVSTDAVDLSVDSINHIT